MNGPHLHEPMSALRLDHLGRVQRILRHIHEHLREPIDLAALASLAKLSPSHLSVVFQGIVGESPYQYVRRLRLERAAIFLHLTTESVIEIALACGFESHEGFTRSFSQAFGCSPRAFRQQRQRVAQIPSASNVHYGMNGIEDHFQPLPNLGASLRVEIVELPRQRLAYLRHQGDYKLAHRVWLPFLWWAARTGRLSKENVFYGLSYDDDSVTPSDLQRYDAAMVVEDAFQSGGSIGAITLEAGQFARTTVVGTMADYWRTSHAFLCQWLPESGFALRGLYSLDRYHVAGNLTNPLKLLDTVRKKLHVDLYIPIQAGPFGRSLLA